MQVREKTFAMSLRGLWERTLALPWLSLPGITVIVLLVCLPFALVEVPPLIDVPGHMGAAAIEAARPGNPLLKYFSWKWVFTLNIGIFDELEGGKRAVFGAVWTLAKDAFKRALGLSQKRDAD